MDPLALLLAALLGALVTGTALVLAGRRRPALDDDRLAAAVRDGVATVAAESDARLQAAVATVAGLAGARVQDEAASARAELDLRSDAFTRQVAEVRAELGRVGDLVGLLSQQRAEQQGTFLQALEDAARRTGELEQTTRALAEALSSPRARGQWGERMADDVLRLAGLREGISYRRQMTLPGGSRPDVTFLLPHDRLLHMDVKFPVDNYLRHVEAVGPAEGEAAAAAFLRDVRARVRELAQRDYVDPETTVGYVLAFIPNEAVYAFVHERDPSLLDDALGQGVVLCSPLTLFAVVALVRQAVDTFLLERTSGEILDVLGRFERQWDAFSEGLDRLGAQLGTVQRSYDQLAGTRRRQLERQLDEVERLRATRAPRAGAEAEGAVAGPTAPDVEPPAPAPLRSTGT